jgi:hypothetical protein
MRFSATFVIIAVLSSLVNGEGATSTKSKSSSKSQKPSEWQVLESRLRNDGDLNVAIEGAISDALKIADPTPTAGDDTEKLSDGLKHGASLLLDKVEKETPGKSLGFILMTRRETNRESESYLFKTSLDGTLEHAAIVQGKLDEHGQAIKGSGASSTKPLEIDSLEVKKRFAKEVDFWLKGKGHPEGKKYLAEMASYRKKLEKK